jgi:methionyl-tRNA formyltransferase
LLNDIFYLNSKMRIVFFGTPSFAVASLKALLRSGDEVIAVVTQPDKRKGRNRIASPPPVKVLALGQGISILQPANIRERTFLDELRRMNPDIIVVVAYGKILPPQILVLPASGCVNVHASLLPKYRGAAPVQWAIIRGEMKTGVTTMLMDEGLDTGDILLQQETDIGAEDNSDTLSNKLSEIGASVLIETIRKLEEGSIKPAPQKGESSYAPPLRKEDGRIRWDNTSRDIYNFVRGMYPWPSAYCYLNKERIKLMKVKVLEGSGIPGRIEKAGEELIVGTADGLISLIDLQPEGKKVMASGEFLRGRRINKGSFFDE